MRANVGNLANYEEEVFVKGVYEVEVTKAEATESDRTGSEGTTLHMTILDGPDLDSGEPSQGQKIITTLWHPNAGMKDGGKFAGRTLRKACEVANVKFDETGFDIDEFVGAIFNVRLKPEEYEGETRPVVKAFLPSA